MSNKYSKPDYLKYFPIILVFVSVIGSYFTLSNRVGNAEEKIEKSDAWLGNQIQETGKIQIAQARLEAKQESILEILRDIKESVKK